MSKKMGYVPELHFNHGLPWNVEDTEYLINWYYIIGIEEMSLALGRTEKTVSQKVLELRKKGLMNNERRKRCARLLNLEDSKTILTY